MTSTVGSEVAAAGDEVARLYDLHARKLRRFCLGRLRSAEDAEDAVQTVFLRVYTALRGGTVPVYEAAWLYKVAHNVCLSRLESGAARARVEQPRDLDELRDVLAAPGERHDELAGLADALAAMPPNLRQAILLREWQGLSYAEIAEALGVSVSAVETLIFRARRHLASALASLQLPWLVRRLRSLLASGRGAQIGAAKLSAAAVVAAVAAGGGVATSVLATRTPAGTTAAATTAPLRSTVAPRLVALPVRRTRTTRSASRLVVVPPVTPAATVVHASSPRAPGPTSAPAAIPVVPSPTPARMPTVTATETAPAAGTTATVPSMPEPTLPAPTVAAATVPTVSVPTATVPTPSAPTVSVPTVSVPAVSVPVVTTPVATLTAPAIVLP